MTSHLTPRTSRLLLLALTSAALLVLSFPSFNQPWAAWVALVPWLSLLRGLGGRQAFWWSYLVGLVFFLGSIWWLIHVTLVGWLVLCAYLALYFGLFGWCVAILEPRTSNLERLALAPSVWVAMEFARSHLFSGFGWSLLAYSQAGWLPVIQIAEVTGAWGVSFLIVLVNTALAECLSARRRDERTTRPVALALLSAVCCLLSAVLYGFWRMPHALASATTHARIAVVQGNIPQEEKWDATRAGAILERYAALTSSAAATRPDLIVWPETSVPGFFELDEALMRSVTDLARSIQRPLLIGAPALRVNSAATGASMTNSAVLMDAAGNFVRRYDKLHLVPFGEFVPFERAFPWLRGLLPPIGDFVPGHSYTVFQLRSRVQGQGSREDLSPSPFTLHPAPISFSALICFEDVFPALARRFVQEGAQLLLVITNDAWFGPTGAAYQHAQASTFRAIELRVPVARAANTGWSGCIDPTGRWIGSVHGTEGEELFVAGTRTCDAPIGPADSFYLRWGDWFAWLCVMATLVGSGQVWRVLPLRHPTRPRRAGLSPSSAAGGVGAPAPRHPPNLTITPCLAPHPPR